MSDTGRLPFRKVEDSGIGQRVQFRVQLQVGSLRLVKLVKLAKNGLTFRVEGIGREAGHAVPTPRVLSVRRVSMTIKAKPTHRPARPFFSSGPCAKPPTWRTSDLSTASLGRSHRSKIGKARLGHAIALMRSLLRLPDSHKLAIVPGSDTGAVEMALWSLLGARGVSVLAWESFGDGWVDDIRGQLKLAPHVHRADYGVLPDLAAVDWADDVVFTWNGTTSGVRVPDGDWIDDRRDGLSICDATSAIFAHDLPWHKLDVTTFSWQKLLGGEGAHGVLILGPRAVERLKNYSPPWPLPKIFRMTKARKSDAGDNGEQGGKEQEGADGGGGGDLIAGLFAGETINTPSLLCVEDAIFALEWMESLGGLEAIMARCAANAATVAELVRDRDWLSYLAQEPSQRSVTSVCLRVDGADAEKIKAMVKLLEDEAAAYDIGGYRAAPPGLRIWCGATVDSADIKALGPWLDWAYTATVS